MFKLIMKILKKRPCVNYYSIQDKQNRLRTFLVKEWFMMQSLEKLNCWLKWFLLDISCCYLPQELELCTWMKMNYGNSIKLSGRELLTSYEIQIKWRSTSNSNIWLCNFATVFCKWDKQQWSLPSKVCLCAIIFYIQTVYISIFSLFFFPFCLFGH